MRDTRYFVRVDGRLPSRQNLRRIVTPLMNSPGSVSNAGRDQESTATKPSMSGRVPPMRIVYSVPRKPSLPKSHSPGAPSRRRFEKQSRRTSLPLKSQSPIGGRTSESMLFRD